MTKMARLTVDYCLLIKALRIEKRLVRWQYDCWVSGETV